MRSRTSIFAAVAAALVVAVGVAATEPAASREPRRIRTDELAPGLTLTTIHDPEGPWIIRVLEVAPLDNEISLDTVTSGQMGAYVRTSDMARANRALAAVNGDFTVWPGRPLHPMATDGRLRSWGLQIAATFAPASTEQQMYVGHRAVSVHGVALATGQSFDVSDWNGADPAWGEVVGYTPYGGSVVRPMRDACSAKLRPLTRLRWAPDGLGVRRTYSVVRNRCADGAMTVDEAVVLTARRGGAGARVVTSMPVGSSVELAWGFPDWARVLDAIGGMPMLLEDGRVTARDCPSYFCGRNPRTAVGVTEEGTVLLFVVDGRKSTSVGMTPIRLAHYLRELGAIDAVNLDGGGTTTMWVRGRGVVNDPSDGSERPTTTALLVLPGPDEGDPLPRIAIPRTAVVTGKAARRVQRSMMHDPGSTGGVLGLP